MSPLRGYVVFIADPGAACFALAPGYLLSAPSALRRCERVWPGVFSRRLRYVAPSGLRGFYCRSRGCVLRTCPWLPSLRAFGAASLRAGVAWCFFEALKVCRPFGATWFLLPIQGLRASHLPLATFSPRLRRCVAASGCGLVFFRGA